MCVRVFVCVCVHGGIRSDVAALSSPGLMHVVGESPLRGHRHSWRQQIFLRVATPQKNSDSIGEETHSHTLTHTKIPQKVSL